jgi:hypothetical protein
MRALGACDRGYFEKIFRSLLSQDTRTAMPKSKPKLQLRSSGRSIYLVVLANALEKKLELRSTVNAPDRLRSQDLGPVRRAGAGRPKTARLGVPIGR